MIAVTIQREVAERLRALPSTGEYGALTVMVQMLADVEVMRVLPRTAFWPAPKIESCLVRLRPKNRLGERAREFSTFLQTLFSARRKMLRGTLGKRFGDVSSVLREMGVREEARPEELAPEQLFRLFEFVEPSRAGGTAAQ